MALLDMIQQVCRRHALPVPTAVISNTDESVIQLLGLANQEGEELARRGTWQVLRNEATFVTTATESQGTLATITGSTLFGYIVPETVWDRTANRPLEPVTDTEWQEMKSSGITGPYSSFRLRGGTFRMLPTPSAGSTIAFEWVSTGFCQSSSGTAQSAWADDTDTGVLSEPLMRLGILWRFRQMKGLDYAQEFQTYEAAVVDALARDAPKRRINLGRRAWARKDAQVPEGSWT